MPTSDGAAMYVISQFRTPERDRESERGGGGPCKPAGVAYDGFNRTPELRAPNSGPLVRLLGRKHLKH